MRLNDDLAVLPLTVARNGQTAVFNLSLITDATQGPTLVDTGVPGQAAAITALLSDLGMGPRDLRRIILTHQDHDHIGSLAELARLSGAEILAGADEADAIDGTVLPRFALPETLAQRPDMREIAAQHRPTPVDVRLAQDSLSFRSQMASRTGSTRPAPPRTSTSGTTSGSPSSSRARSSVPRRPTRLASSMRTTTTASRPRSTGSG